VPACSKRANLKHKRVVFTGPVGGLATVGRRPEHVLHLQHSCNRSNLVATPEPFFTRAAQYDVHYDVHCGVHYVVHCVVQLDGKFDAQFVVWSICVFVGLVVCSKQSSVGRAFGLILLKSRVQLSFEDFTGNDVIHDYQA
jgi:hypothetical protein